LVTVALPDGTTALHYAAHQGDLTTVDLLLRAGAKVMANQYGSTPLLLAAANGNATVVSRLLRAGADPNAAAPGGETPLMTAAHAGRTDAVNALLRDGKDHKDVRTMLPVAVRDRLRVHWTDGAFVLARVARGISTALEMAYGGSDPLLFNPLTPFAWRVRPRG
jgi:ankyrin repeat protein